MVSGNVVPMVVLLKTEQSVRTWVMNDAWHRRWGKKGIIR